MDRPTTPCRPRRLAVVLATAACSALVLSACAGADQQGSAAHRMSVWVSGTGLGQSIGTLVADNARVAKVIANGPGAVHAACGTIVNDAEMANSNLPSPDPQVTDLLTQAYGLEGVAGNECYDAGVGNKELMARSHRDAIKAEALFDQALQRIREIDGEPVSTTTTTDNNAGGGIFG